MPDRPLVAVVMGVSAAGKTTVGQALAQALGWRFDDGDDFHSAENIARMHAGVALNDADRAPWLDRMAAHVQGLLARGEHGVLAASVLKQRYRDVLGINGRTVREVYLWAPRAVLEERLRNRIGHFMPVSLLDSQLDALEEPREAPRLDARESPEVLVRTLRAFWAV